MINTNIVFQYIYFITRLYVPNVVNQKKIKQLFEAIPFFMPNHQSSLLFQIIKENSIVNYYDTNNQMVTYGYIVYKKYHIKNNLTYLDQEAYIKHYDAILFVSEQQKKKEQRQKVTFIIFICIVLICIYFIYAT